MFSTKIPLLAFLTKIIEIFLGKIPILVKMIKPWILINVSLEG